VVKSSPYMTTIAVPAARVRPCGSARLRASRCAAAIAILATGALAWTAAPAGARSVARARAAHTLHGTETGRLHLVSASGSQLTEEGSASGPLPGRMRAHLNLGPTFSGTVTIYAAGGSITGHGHATPRGSGRYQSFAGTLEVTGGTGRYAHAHGHAGFYGTFDRRTDALVIQTTGQFSY
jgi:hypothetical protein